MHAMPFELDRFTADLLVFAKYLHATEGREVTVKMAEDLVAAGVAILVKEVDAEFALESLDLARKELKRQG
jgi:hypothetical protein